MKRSEAREQAFILIFERSFRDEPIDEIIEQARQGRNLELDKYAFSLVSEVCAHMAMLDDLISNFSKKWKLNRISRVALSILRMSLWEIGYVDSVPAGAAINEAVELAKKYGTTEDFSFVNGVLGAYVREREGHAEQPAVGQGEQAAQSGTGE